jgi:hypothetical protein
MAIGQTLKLLEDVSKRHFGRKCRMPVAAAVAVTDSPVWARQVARAVEIGENQAAAELKELVGIGALQLVPSSFDRRVVYQRVAHHFWDFVRATVDETIEARNLPGGPGRFWAELSSRLAPDRLPEPDV